MKHFFKVNPEGAGCRSWYLSHALKLLFIQSDNNAHLNDIFLVVSLPHPPMKTPIKFVDFDGRIFNNYDIVCYTDGRKINRKLAFQHDFELFHQQFLISGNYSVFLIELLCLFLNVMHIFHYTCAKNFDVQWLLVFSSCSLWC